MDFLQEKQKQKEFISKLISKCWEDAEFKAKLIANPVETMESFLGKKINDKAGKTIHVNDQTNTEIVYINIPSNPNFDDMELSDAELEAVAGGDYEILWTLWCSIE